MELNPRHDLDSNDRRGDEVNDKAERRPPSGVRDEVTPMLPEILEPVSYQSDDE